MNQIAQKQNEETYLRCIAAFRQLYTDDKLGNMYWVIAATVVAVAGTGVLAALDVFSAYIAFASLLVLALEVVLYQWCSRCRKDAARIQEWMDCNLFELPWNEALTKPPKTSLIHQAAERYQITHKLASLETLCNWYETVNPNDPIHKARIACQQENLGWNSQLVNLYIRWLSYFLAAFIILLVIIGLAAKLELRTFFAGPLFLVLPVLVALVHQIVEHREAGKRLEEMNERGEHLWEKASQGAGSDELTPAAREFQTEIFHHRSKNPPVPDFLYECAKKIVSSRTRDDA